MKKLLLVGIFSVAAIYLFWHLREMEEYFDLDEWWVVHNERGY